jgi:hypothetical protein
MTTPHPINRIRIQAPVSVQNLTVFPVTQAASTGPEYISSSVAIEQHGLVVTEISDSGSVPNLMVENPSAFRVLLLDGEELHGAKQNRVINTTLLLAPRSKTVIDVSCTESGRWDYQSPTFSHSKVVMSAQARRKKSRSVSQSLHMSQTFESDQGEVWDEVQELSGKVGSHSETNAMAEAYEKLRSDLEQAIDQIPLVPDQCGLIAMIDGRPAGIDLLSRTEVYAGLHAQLIKSYAMEALASERACIGSGKAPKGEPLPPAPDTAAAKAFLERSAAVKGKAYPSVALGSDWRFVDTAIVGSGLDYEDTWIHMAYFMDDPKTGGHNQPRRAMVRMSRRSRYRRGGDVVE